MLLALLGAVLIIAIHPAVALREGMPQMSGNAADQLTFLVAIWTVDGAILGAALVSLFFLFQAVQGSRPAAAVVGEIVKRLRVWFWLGLLSGATLGTGESYVLVRGTSFLEPADLPSVSALPLLDGALLSVSVLATVWLVIRATGFLHPDAISRLTVELAQVSAVGLSRSEGFLRQIEDQELRRTVRKALANREAKAASRVALSIAGKLWAVWERRSCDKNKGVLASLFTELKERTLAGLGVDDVSSLRLTLQVQVTAIDATSHGAGPNKRTASVGDGPRSLSRTLSQPWALMRAEYDHHEMLSEALRHGSPRCQNDLLWSPIAIWRKGLARQDGDVARFGLDLFSSSYALVAKSGNKDLVKLVRNFWRDQLYGPEHFVKSDARIGVRRDNVSEDGELHLIASSIEVQETLLSIAALALALEDYDTAADFAASLSTVHNVFHTVESDKTSSQGLRQAVADYDRVRLQGLALLVGLAAVRYWNGDDKVVSALRFMLECLCEQWALAEVQAQCNLTRDREPEWLWSSIAITDEPPVFNSGRPFDYAYPEDLQGLAIVLARSHLALHETQFGPKIPIPGKWRPSKLEALALERIRQCPERWRELVAPRMLPGQGSPQAN